jgi:hypothetical protein
MDKILISTGLLSALSKLSRAQLQSSRREVFSKASDVRGAPTTLAKQSNDHK